MTKINGKNISVKYKWYFYLHTDGSVIVKRFFDARDLSDARMSNFVTYVYGPYLATNREEAEAYAENKRPE